MERVEHTKTTLAIYSHVTINMKELSTKQRKNRPSLAPFRRVKQQKPLFQRVFVHYLYSLPESNQQLLLRRKVLYPFN